MLSMDDKQFSLNGQGQVLDQDQPVGQLIKGQSILEPGLEVTGEADKDKLQSWLAAHIASILEPLIALKDDSGLSETVKGITSKVYEAMGTLPREQIEDLIAGLDQEARAVLRAKRIRLGPILVFQPDLNKPAAVHMRALLWSLFNDKPLPAAVPPDGVVSLQVNPKSVDPEFYQVIGYPVYGSRAVRIDMLDRVVSAVYDGAEKGQFKARHQMAEWLGSSIEGLYEVLEAMGHKKISEPDESEEKKDEQDKPELATFRLKKGKAFKKSEEKKKKKPPKKSGKRNKKTNKTPKVMEVGPKPKLEDSPFAVLEQLKVKNDGG